MAMASVVTGVLAFTITSTAVPRPVFRHRILILVGIVIPPVRRFYRAGKVPLKRVTNSGTRTNIAGPIRTTMTGPIYRVHQVGLNVARIRGGKDGRPLIPNTSTHPASTRPSDPIGAETRVKRCINDDLGIISSVVVFVRRTIIGTGQIQHYFRPREERKKITDTSF